MKTAGNFIVDLSFFDSGTLLSLDEESLLIGWGKRSWISDASKSTEAVFYFPDFFLEDKAPWFKHEYWKIISITDFFMAHSFIEEIKEKADWTCDSKAIFFENFTDLSKMFKEKSLDKAVPYSFWKTSTLMNKARLKTSITAALQSCLNFKGHLYGFWTKEEGILGVSPELLFQGGAANKISTVACAGTHKDKNQLMNRKFSEEHQIVVQGIEESLKEFGQVQKMKTTIKELAIFSHLLTPIEVCLDKPLEFDQIINALHPTPALGAYPRERGKMWLKKYQKQVNRYRFGAPVGCVVPQEKKAVCYVAIRNVQWDAKGMFIGAGCGVTAKSQVEDEWQEIQLKFQSIREMLKL